MFIRLTPTQATNPLRRPLLVFCSGCTAHGATCLPILSALRRALKLGIETRRQWEKAGMAEPFELFVNASHTPFH